MIFGLAWQLILDTQLKQLPRDPTKFDFTEEDGHRQALLLWTQTRLNDTYKVHDFHSS